MSEPLEQSTPRLQLVLALIFLIIMVGAAIDLVLDRPETLWSVHVLFEAGMVLVSLGAAAYLGSGWVTALRQVRNLKASVEASSAERDAWKEQAGQILAGLSEAVDRQFSAWALTPTERETALMLLKGYSHKRIARLTERSDRTVRQHAVAVYRKAGLAGRSELSGFFLEGLFSPAPGDGADTSEEAGGR
jgi:DNA-binding CsgD family transcriptional regulator